MRLRRVGLRPQDLDCVQIYDNFTPTVLFSLEGFDPVTLRPEVEWRRVSGRGTLWCWVVMHQPYFPAFADEIPYLVAEEGPG